MKPGLDGTVAIPVALAEKVLRLAYYFGEPQFTASVGDGDFIEAGRTVVLDAELQVVASYPMTDRSLGERLAELFNAITVEFAELLPDEVRREAAQLADRERHGR